MPRTWKDGTRASQPEISCEPDQISKQDKMKTGLTMILTKIFAEVKPSRLFPKVIWLTVGAQQ